MLNNGFSQAATKEPAPNRWLQPYKTPHDKLELTMKMTYLTPGIIVLGGLAFYFTSCNEKQSSKQQDDYVSKTGDTVRVHHLPDNPFHDLRNRALRATSEELQITMPADQTKVYGIVMDWDLGEGIATFVSFSTGDASMYLSTGGGLIGSGQHENVNKAVKAFIGRAEQYLDKTTKIDTTPLPDKNCVRFYFMTNNGKFTAQENLKNFEDNSSPWLPLFEEANKVIFELRLNQEKR